MKSVRWLVMVVLLMFCLTMPAFAGHKDREKDKQEGSDRKVDQRKREMEARRSRQDARPEIRYRETRREDRPKDIRVESRRGSKDRRTEEKVRPERRREEPRVRTEERKQQTRPTWERERRSEPKRPEPVIERERTRKVETSKQPRFERNSERQTFERPPTKERTREVRIERVHERPADYPRESVRKNPRQVREISRDSRERSSKEIRGNVNSWNRESFDRSDRRRPDRDRVGNPIPKGAIFIERENRHDRRVRPSNHFVFVPRARYENDYFDRHDGHRYFRRHHHHETVVTVFYYPYYYSDPDWYGFYHPGYYPSVYALWGWSPGWIPPRRVYYEPADYFYRGSYYGSLDYRGAEQAIADINDGWINGDIDLINRHLTNRVDIRISFNGRYSYTASTSDYYAMTADAMASMTSCSVSFSRPAWISSYEIFVTGRQVFTDPDNEEHILYISYRLRKLGYNWYIVAFGSSNRAIRNPYR